MNLDQQKAGGEGHTPPAIKIGPLPGTGISVGNNSESGSDGLGMVQHGATCSPYTYGGQGPIIAPAGPQPAKWDNIPKELRDLPQWCVADNDKIPRVAAPGLPRARSNDVTTWSTFEEACKCAALHDLYIGFMLNESDPFTCIDIDVKDNTEPEQLERYERIVAAFDSYTERSRSGRGVHVWVKGKVPQGKRRDGVEVYSDLRFMICTGDTLHQNPIVDRQALLDILVSELGGNETAEPMTDRLEVEADDAILKRAQEAANGAKFTALINGNWDVIGHSDHSRADMSLIQMLAEYSGNNDQVKRLFLQSALGQRDKATKRWDYVDRTLAQARRIQAREGNAEHGEQVATQLIAEAHRKCLTQQSPAKLTEAGGLRLIAANEIASRPPMKWLVPRMVPEKGIGAIFGQPGAGKSFLVLDLLAAIVSGSDWFGIPAKAAPVVYIALEGQAGMPQRIRAYRAKKGSLDRIAFIEHPIDLRQLDNVNKLIELIRDAGLGGGVVCIDTLAASAPGMDENTSADMGRLIAHFQHLQTQLDCLVLVVHHSGKDESRGLRGWSGLNGALDFSISVSRVSEDKANTNRRLEITKSKDGSDGMKVPFSLEQVVLGQDDDGNPITSCVVSHTMQERINESELDAEDDNFIWQWVKEQVEAGNHPSKNSLKNQLNDMKPKRTITQKRVLAAIERLMATNRLQVASFKSPSGNTWIQAVDSIP